MKKITTLIILTTWCFSVFSQQQSKFKQLLSMDLGAMLKVKVATGTDKQLSEAPAVVSVITSKDIITTGAKTFAEAVERVPGLHVATSINRGSNNFSIRGIQTDNTPQILILIDGTEISELSAWPTPYAFNLPTHFIDRIEIIRGPGSAVYGADAFSGVINIITKSPSNKNEFQTGVNFGSFDYLETWFNANYVSGKLKVGLSVTHEELGNDSDRTTPYGVLNRERTTDNIYINANFGQFSWKSWYWRTDKNMGIGAGIFGNDFDRDISKTWKTQINWDGNLSDTMTGALDLSYSQNSYDALFQLFPPGFWPIGSDGNILAPPFTPVEFPDGVIGQPIGNTERIQLNTSLIYSGMKNHRLRFGFGLENAELTDIKEFKNFGPGVLDVANIPQDFVSDTIVDVSGTPFVYVPPYDRDLWYISVQDEWKFAQGWELTAGIRHDRYSDFGSTTNPRLALVWNNSDTVTSKLLYGTAFRAPKVSELAFVNNPTVLGNPDLAPEKIETLELAFDYRPTKSFTGLLNIFTYKSKDLILLDQNFTYQNIGRQDGHGVEIELSWQQSEKLQVNTSFSLLNSDLPLTDEDKAQVPGTTFYFDVRYQIAPSWLVTMQNYWITDRKRQLSDSRPDVDNYLQADITLMWQLDPSWNTRIGIKNLFNEKIVEPLPNSPLFGLGLGFPDDYPKKNRSIFCSIEFKF